jgi:hypothetical protein
MPEVSLHQPEGPVAGQIDQVFPVIFPRAYNKGLSRHPNSILYPCFIKQLVKNFKIFRHKFSPHIALKFRRTFLRALSQIRPKFSKLFLLHDANIPLPITQSALLLNILSCFKPDFARRTSGHGIALRTSVIVNFLFSLY